MTVLSEWEIVKRLGKGIDIYPFNGINSSLVGCCLNLTASEFAFIIEAEREYGKQKDYSVKRKAILQKSYLKKETDYFVIPPRRTALVWTQESIRLDGRFCGSIHSKVNMAARGIGHISTRVNPYWQGGVLSIALHNLSDEIVRISVGETIAYLRFHKLTSESSRFHRGADSRQSALAKLDDAFPDGCFVEGKLELKRWIEKERWRDGDQQSLLKALEEDRKARKEEFDQYKKAYIEWLKVKRWCFFLSTYQKRPWLDWIRIVAIVSSTSLVTNYWKPAFNFMVSLFSFLKHN